MLATRAEVADSFWARLRGLLGRAELPAGTAAATDTRAGDRIELEPVGS